MGEWELGMGMAEELSDQQRRELAKLDRTSSYVALWFVMFAVVVGIVVLALYLRGVI
jgi:magnesium-transporting ATPase (P-type)